MYHYIIFCTISCRGRYNFIRLSRLCASCAPVSIISCQSPAALTGPTILLLDRDHAAGLTFIRPMIRTINAPGMGRVVQRRACSIEAPRPAGGCTGIHAILEPRGRPLFSWWILPRPSSETTGPGELGGNVTKKGVARSSTGDTTRCFTGSLFRYQFHGGKF